MTTPYIDPFNVILICTRLFMGKWACRSKNSACNSPLSKPGHQGFCGRLYERLMWEVLWVNSLQYKNISPSSPPFL